MTMPDNVRPLQEHWQSKRPIIKNGINLNLSKLKHSDEFTPS